MPIHLREKVNYALNRNGIPDSIARCSSTFNLEPQSSSRTAPQILIAEAAVLRLAGDDAGRPCRRGLSALLRLLRRLPDQFDKAPQGVLAIALCVRAAVRKDQHTVLAQPMAGDPFELPQHIFAQGGFDRRALKRSCAAVDTY